MLMNPSDFCHHLDKRYAKFDQPLILLNFLIILLFKLLDDEFAVEELLCEDLYPFVFWFTDFFDSCLYLVKSFCGGCWFEYLFADMPA